MLMLTLMLVLMLMLMLFSFSQLGIPDSKKFEPTDLPLKHYRLDRFVL